MWLNIVSKSDDFYIGYGGFHSMRKDIAKSAWLGELEEYEWFWGKKEWPTYKEEPLVRFLSHSDCEWDLRVTLKLINRLKEIKLSEWWGKLDDLIELMQVAYDENRKILRFW